MKQHKIERKEAKRKGGNLPQKDLTKMVWGEYGDINIYRGGIKVKKKLVKFLVCFCLAAVAMGGCGNDNETTSGREENVETTTMETGTEEPETGTEEPETETEEHEVEAEAEKPEAEAEAEIEAEKPLEYVEPTAADFEYKYDEELGGVVITKYNGEAEAIRIPAQIDGEPVISIGEKAFLSCSSLTGIIIPDSVTSIGESAFSGCSSLTEIMIPDSVTSIKRFAFDGCRSLTKITLPDGLQFINEYTFSGCSSLTEITIPDGVTSIGQFAFSNCSSLTKITIPDGVTSIGEQAFYKCSSLTEITLPDSVTSIQRNAFLGCTGLTVTYQRQEYTSASGTNWL